ncbi:uncharacterized protein B0T15DRAFT_531887 [Chaetomium strumarium]|uniref:Uncharacterized protein n=1 Tax=Chaetomium strumarium TaxID=1170767 RepID=A0AAJ0GSX8_9PEZI|nr:hypothetical protein B0T15DRAFT_531887 [Chaetomium strumarium]
MTRTLGLGLALGACLLQLATLTSASPVQPIREIKDVARRDTTDTTTVWIDPTTVTVNPRDPTITREAGWTTTTGPPPFISTVTSSCITYNYSYPAGHETTTTTTTVFRQSTVTVTDTNRPTETQYFFHTPTVTVTTPLATYVSYHCLNTLVVQYADWEYLTWTWSQWEHVASTTGLCLTTSTRSTTIPGFTLPASSTRTLEDWEYFSVPGVSVVTKNTVAIATDVTSVIPGTSTRTVCDSRNLRPTTTTTITVTRQATTTRTVTGGGPGCVTRAPSRSDVEAAAVVGTPVEVHTVVYTTVTVIDNSVYTLTGTAVVDVNTAEFPVTRIAYSTVTGPGATVTATICR